MIWCICPLCDYLGPFLGLDLQWGHLFGECPAGIPGPPKLLRSHGVLVTFLPRDAVLEIRPTANRKSLRAAQGWGNGKGIRIPKNKTANNSVPGEGTPKARTSYSMPLPAVVQRLAITIVQASCPTRFPAKWASRNITAVETV